MSALAYMFSGKPELRAYLPLDKVDLSSCPDETEGASALTFSNAEVLTLVSSTFAISAASLLLVFFAA